METSCEFTLDQARIDVEAARAFLATTYWAKGIPEAVQRKAIQNSLCVAALCEGKQVGFARAVTDRATFAYLADVYVLESHRGQGLARKLLETLFAHPELRDLRRWLLVTRDAQAVYEKFGFTPLAHPDRLMERHDPDVYARIAAADAPGAKP